MHAITILKQQLEKQEWEMGTEKCTQCCTCKDDLEPSVTFFTNRTRSRDTRQSNLVHE